MPSQFLRSPRSLDKSLLVAFTLLLGVVIILFLSFFILHQRHLNKHILNNVNDASVLLDKTVSLYRQQLKNEFKAVSLEVLAVHQEMVQELRKGGEVSDGWLKDHKKTITAKINQSVDINLISGQYKIIKSTYPSEMGLDLSQFPDACKALQEVRQQGGIRTDIPVFEPAGRLFRAYTLSYLEERDCFLQLAVKLIKYNNFFSILQEIKNSSPVISTIDLFVVEQDSRGELYVASFTKPETTITDQEREAVLSSVATSDTTTYSQKDGRCTYKNYFRVISSARHQPGWFQNLEYYLVYRFKLDTTEQRHFMTNSIFYAVVLFSLVCACLFLLWRYMQQTFAQPLGSVVKHIQDSVPVPAVIIDKSAKELAIISRTYNHPLYEITITTQALNEKNAELKKSLDEIKTLTGLLPMCANCHKIRDDQGYWSKVETYIRKHLDVDISHGICPECVKKLYPEAYVRMEAKKKASS